MVNSKTNQNCLSCAHFQPYEETFPVETPNGECRYKPQNGQLHGAAETFDQRWPYIADGEDFWCSTWKKTDLGTVTQSGQRAPSFPTDYTNFHINPWNRRSAMNQSCWNCNHWQREYPLPLEPGQSTGECRKLPPPSVLEFDDNVESFIGESMKWVYYGNLYWCSCWEHAEGDVPAVPPAPV